MYQGINYKIKRSMKNRITNTTVRFVLHVLFFVFGAAYILADYIHIKAFHIFKIFPLLVLIALILPDRIHDGTKKLIAGLVTGLIGDVILKYEKSMTCFAIGAGFFLLGHICYNIYFFNIWQIKKQNLLMRKKYSIIFGTVFFLSISIINLVMIVSDKLKQEQKIAVIIFPIYLIFLSLDSVNAYLLKISEKHADKHYWLLLIGTVLFLLSDNAIGITSFTDFAFIVNGTNINSVVIMTTYYLGQYFIVLNSHKIYNKESESSKKVEDKASMETSTSIQ